VCQKCAENVHHRVSLCRSRFSFPLKKDYYNPKGGFERRLFKDQGFALTRMK
jgi:hypothetical protein